jgi:hypothetical protein
MSRCAGRPLRNMRYRTTRATLAPPLTLDRLAVALDHTGAEEEGRQCAGCRSAGRARPGVQTTRCQHLAVRGQGSRPIPRATDQLSHRLQSSDQRTPRLRFGIHSPALSASINLQLVSLATPAGGDLIRRHQHGRYRGVTSWLEERMHTVEQFSRGPRRPPDCKSAMRDSTNCPTCAPGVNIWASLKPTPRGSLTCRAEPPRGDAHWPRSQTHSCAQSSPFPWRTFAG